MFILPRKKIFHFMPLFFALVLLACSLGGKVPSLSSPATITPEFAFPTPRPVTGRMTEQLPDGSIKFTDQQVSYSLIIPATWLILPFNPQDVAAIAKLISAKDPGLAKAIDQIKPQDIETYRLIAMDAQPAHRKAGVFSIVYITVEYGSPLSQAASMWVVLPILRQDIKNNYPDAKFLASSVQEMPKGEEIALIELTVSVNSANNTAMTVYEKLAYIAVHSNLVVITQASPFEAKDLVSSDFDQLLGSYSLHSP
jgi:hypothetical protein